MNYQHLYNEIKKIVDSSNLKKDMVMTRENTPYHREANVWVHTGMVLDQFKSTITDWHKSDFLGMIACLFHDVGKPICETIENGRKRYIGHELRSARMFVDFARTHLDLDINDVRIIETIIEYHLCWKHGSDKLARIAATLGEYSSVLERVMMADKLGRISDDPISSDGFIKRYRSLQPLKDKKQNTRKAYITIGTSGSGKTTFVESLGANVFNIDQIKLDRYGLSYDKSWQAANDDPVFKSFLKDMFINFTKAGHDSIVLDSVNASRKNRAFFIEQCRKNKYDVIAVFFSTSLNTVLSRQHTRNDKTISRKSVEQQYYSVCVPLLGEFDDIIDIDTN